MLEVHGLRPADAQKEHEQKLCKIIMNLVLRNYHIITLSQFLIARSLQ